MPKAGHAPGECEDAVAVDLRASGATLAVADGATEAAYSRAWAQALVEGYVDAGASLEGALRAARRAVEALASGRADAPWYAAQKAEAGAFAAFLGVRISASGTWRAEAVGDVNLLLLRGGERVEAWPLTDADAFDTRPDLLASRADLPTPRRLHREGAWRPGDVLLVTTDALAAYLLATPSQAGAFASADADTWPRLIADARAAGMKNDDVALVRVVLSPEATLEGP